MKENCQKSNLLTKRSYEAPRAEIVELEQVQVFCTSGAKGDSLNKFGFI